MVASRGRQQDRARNARAFGQFRDRDVQALCGLRDFLTERLAARVVFFLGFARHGVFPAQHPTVRLDSWLLVCGLFWGQAPSPQHGLREGLCVGGTWPRNGVAVLVEDADGLFRWPEEAWLPLAFSLRAERKG